MRVGTRERYEGRKISQGPLPVLSLIQCFGEELLLNRHDVLRETDESMKLCGKRSLQFMCLAFAFVSFSARADYQAGTFRCYKPGPDEDKASIWRITFANDNIRAPFVEFTSPSIAAAQPFTIRSYGTVTELPVGTVVSVSAPLQGARYFNLIFEKGGVRMGDTACHNIE
jgi:hypothetical protein